jgi:glyoxylase-like metal-dependent hydrolase (beta-lactamase superfamily II)
MKTFTFQHSAFALVLLALASLTADAQVRAPEASSSAAAADSKPTAGAGVARFKVGRFEVIALSDGTLPLDVHPLLKGASSAEIDALLDRDFQKNPVETSINAFLVDTGSRVILVDTGAGDLFGPVGGRLPRSLAAAGYRPEDISDILITHIHTDHSGGLTRGGKIVFPNATVHVGAADAAFFLDAANVGKGLEARHLEEASKTVEPYRRANRLKLFSGPTQLFPGVAALPTPGHTPGHSFYRVESEGEAIEFWGDIVHVGPVQMSRPEITITFDIDQDAARAQRKRQFEAAARERKLLAVAHLNFPGVGHLRAVGSGYEWVPAPYTNRD